MNDIDTLIHRQAIADQLYRYCRGLDRMDLAMARSVFHPRAHSTYEGRHDGLAYDFLDGVWVGHSRLIRHSHNLTNIYIEIRGEQAVSETYVIVLLRQPVDGGAVARMAAGRYLDRWIRHEGRWVIERRRYVPEFNETPGTTNDMVSLDVTSSRRDDLDPSFDLFDPMGAMTPDPSGGGRFLRQPSPAIPF